MVCRPTNGCMHLLVHDSVVGDRVVRQLHKPRILLLGIVAIACFVVIATQIPARQHANVSHQAILDSGIVFVVSLTSYPDLLAARAQLSLKLADNVRTEGYHSIFVDADSSPLFARRAEQYGAKVLRQTGKGIGPGLRQGLLEASRGCEDKLASLNKAARSDALPMQCVVVFVEAEKHPLISELYRIVFPILSGQADIVYVCLLNV